MKTEKIYKILPWAFFIIGTISYVSLCFNNNVWMDEAFTASLVNTDMAGVISRSMADTLPPLYNIYLKIITDIFGYTVHVMKLASVLPMILTMLLSVTVVKKRHGNKVSSIFTLALTAMPYLMYFGVEIRMYSLGFFFATASGIYAYEVIKDSNRKNRIAFTVLSVLAGYSHHFAFVTVGFVYLFVLLYYIFRDRSHIKNFFICLIATFILYLPCLLVTIKQIKSVSGYFSMPEVTLKVFIKYMYYPYMVGVRLLSIILVIIMLILLVKCILSIIKDKEHSFTHMYSLFMFLIYYGVLLFGTAVSKIMTANIFVDRYLFFSFGLIWLFYSIEADNTSNIVIPCILSFTLIIGIASYISEYRIEYGVNPDEMISYLNENVTEDDALIVSAKTEAPMLCLTFYQPKLIYYRHLDEAKQALDDGKCENIWIAVDKGDSTIDELEEISELNISPEYISDFQFDRYDVEIYHISK